MKTVTHAHSSKAPPLSEAAKALLTTVQDQIAQGKKLRMMLPEKGVVYMERPLPFLTVYRRPEGRPDPGCDQLVTSQAAYIVGSGSEAMRKPLMGVVNMLCRLCQPSFGAFLIVEIWTRPPGHPPVKPLTEVPTPAFRLFGQGPNGKVASLMDLLESHLKLISVGGVKANTRQARRPGDFPHRPRPFFGMADANALNCIQIGIEVEPIFQQGATEVFPSVLKRIRRSLSYTLQRGFYRFVEDQTTLRPKDYHSLGKHALVQSVWRADQRLQAIAASFDFLREINPVNIDAVWKELKRSGFESIPPFRYRPLSIDPSLMKRDLFAIPLERIEDPTIAYLFQQRQAELDRMLTMLSDRGTSRFVLGSRQLHGPLSPSVTRAADAILEKIPAHKQEVRGGRKLTPPKLAEMAKQEIAHYQQQWAEVSVPVLIRPDVIAGIMVSRGRLLISEESRMPVTHAEALLQHEVGTHLVTYFNGKAQRLSQLSSGLAGYEQLQEGLAVLAEYLVGGLTLGRMRTLAARVAGAQVVIEGGTFIDCFRMLCRYGFGRRAAFMLTVRLYRGGGLIKDCIYLRGLNEVLKYLRDGGELQPLFVGKISTKQIPIVKELMSRRVISPPKLMPRYLAREDCQKRIAELRLGKAVHELLEIDSD